MEQSEHTLSTSASTAQGPSSSASTPPIASTPSVISSPPTAKPLPSQTFECASSSWIFCGPTRMAHMWNHQHQVMVQYDMEGTPVGEIAWEMHFFSRVLVRRSDIIPVEPKNWRLMDATIRDWVWEEIWRRYDFSDHERARDARLKKIEELYRGYKIKFHRGWLEHQRDTLEELVPWIQDCPSS
ncbi:hypothetical protein COCNU_scaffold001797G000010 [Cocos nucifera]|nr:hypothetical protein [Cocos nucifera]